jgi:peroxiredoxin
MSDQTFAIRYRFIAALLTMLVGIASLSARADDVTSPARMIGSNVPDWRLKTLDGRTRILSQFNGRAVVLNFWATWCTPCRMETKWLSELYAKYRPKGLEVLGVSMDEPSDRAEVQRFVEFYNVNYLILVHGQSIADRYGGIQYLPQTFFIDRTGKIVNVTRGIHDKEALEADIQAIVQ